MRGLWLEGGGQTAACWDWGFWPRLAGQLVMWQHRPCGVADAVLGSKCLLQLSMPCTPSSCCNAGGTAAAPQRTRGRGGTWRRLASTCGGASSFACCASGGHVMLVGQAFVAAVQWNLPQLLLGVSRGVAGRCLASPCLCLFPLHSAAATLAATRALWCAAASAPRQPRCWPR